MSSLCYFDVVKVDCDINNSNSRSYIIGMSCNDTDAVVNDYYDDANDDDDDDDVMWANDLAELRSYNDVTFKHTHCHASKLWLHIPLFLHYLCVYGHVAVAVKEIFSKTFTVLYTYIDTISSQYPATIEIAYLLICWKEGHEKLIY